MLRTRLISAAIMIPLVVYGVLYLSTDMFLLILAAIWEVSSIQPDLRPEVLLAVLYIGAVPTVIGFVAWNEGVRRLGSSGAMVFYNTLPLYGALLCILFLGEQMELVHIVGGALIIGGGLWASKGD